MNTPKATWGKIKHWNLLSYEHRELLKKEICPFYKECTKPIYVNENEPSFLNNDMPIANIFGTYVHTDGFYA